MRRFRPLHRRQRSGRDIPEESMEYAEEDGETVFAPFVPVSASSLASEENEDAESAYVPRPVEARRRLRAPHVPSIRLPSLGIQVRFGVLISVVLLIAAGIFGTLLNLGRIRSDVETWWPGVVILGSLLWMIAALVQRRVALFLGGAAFAGVGLSLLMDTQEIARLDDTLLGVVLVTTGLGIVIRGFLLRQQTS